MKSKYLEFEPNMLLFVMFSNGLQYDLIDSYARKTGGKFEKIRLNIYILSSAPLKSL